MHCKGESRAHMRFAEAASFVTKSTNRWNMWRRARPIAPGVASASAQHRLRWRRDETLTFRQ